MEKKFVLSRGLEAARRHGREYLAEFIEGLLHEEAGEDGLMTESQIKAFASMRFSVGEAEMMAEAVVRMCTPKRGEKVLVYWNEDELLTKVAERGDDRFDTFHPGLVKPVNIAKFWREEDGIHVTTGWRSLDGTEKWYGDDRVTYLTWNESKKLGVDLIALMQEEEEAV